MVETKNLDMSYEELKKLTKNERILKLYECFNDCKIVKFKGAFLKIKGDEAVNITYREMKKFVEERAFGLV